jgi:hypothetical protein
VLEFTDEGEDVRANNMREEQNGLALPAVVDREKMNLARGYS